METYQNTLIALLVIVLATLSGCEADNYSDDEASPTSGDEQSSAYTGPETRVTIEAGGTSVVVRLHVPTGGWRFELDEHEREGGVVRLYATLEAPPPGMMVTQAIEQKRLNWETSEPVARAKVFIRIARRGESVAAASYHLAGEAD